MKIVKIYIIFHFFFTSIMNKSICRHKAQVVIHGAYLDAFINDEGFFYIKPYPCKIEGQFISTRSNGNNSKLLMSFLELNSLRIIICMSCNGLLHFHLHDV